MPIITQIFFFTGRTQILLYTNRNVFFFLFVCFCLWPAHLLVFSSSAELSWHLTVESVPPDVYGTLLLIFSNNTAWKCELIWILLWWFSVKSDEICSVLAWKPCSCRSAFVSHHQPCFVLLSSSFFFTFKSLHFPSLYLCFLCSSSLCVLSLTYYLFLSVALTDFWSHLSLLLSLPIFSSSSSSSSSDLLLSYITPSVHLLCNLSVC